MNFFWTKNEFDVWTKENGFDNSEDIYCLDIDGAMEASYDIFYYRRFNSSNKDS